MAKRIKITVKRITEYRDLMAEYENPIEHTCDMHLGQSFVVENGDKPAGMCDTPGRLCAPLSRSWQQVAGTFSMGG